MNKLTPFHLAIPVSNLEKSREFYRDVLGCKEGRSSEHWVDFDFFGHQLVLHEDLKHKGQKYFNEVDGKKVPIPHFGAVLNWNVFQNLSDTVNNLAFNANSIIDSGLFDYDNNGQLERRPHIYYTNEIFDRPTEN